MRSRRIVLDCVFPEPTEEYRSFEEELAALGRLVAETMALELLRPLWDHGAAATRPFSRTRT